MLNGENEEKGTKEEAENYSRVNRKRGMKELRKRENNGNRLSTKESIIVTYNFVYKILPSLPRKSCKENVFN